MGTFYLLDKNIAVNGLADLGYLMGLADNRGSWAFIKYLLREMVDCPLLEL